MLYIYTFVPLYFEVSPIREALMHYYYVHYNIEIEFALTC